LRDRQAATVPFAPCQLQAILTEAHD